MDDAVYGSSVTCDTRHLPALDVIRKNEERIAGSNEIEEYAPPASMPLVTDDPQTASSMPPGIFCDG